MSALPMDTVALQREVWRIGVEAHRELAGYARQMAGACDGVERDVWLGIAQGMEDSADKYAARVGVASC